MKCKSCSAPVHWVEMESGKKMPLNPEPVHAGTIVIRTDGLREVGHAETRDERADRLLRDETAYVPHWATCQQRKEWRRN